MIESRAIRNISLVKRKVLAIWQSAGLGSGRRTSQFVVVHVKPHLHEVSRANHRNEPYFLVTVGPRKRHRFAPVTDVKVLADCMYPISRRIVMVEVKEEDTKDVEAEKEESEKERERKTDPHLNHPPKIKFSFPSVLRLFPSLPFFVPLFTSLDSLIFPLGRPSSSISTHKNATTDPSSRETNELDVSRRGSMIPFQNNKKTERIFLAKS